MTKHWTIAELTEEVERALSTGYEAPENGQVRAVPNTRTIRYYTTLGLLSRPAEMRGRTALYDRRHLVELVAIKRLQAESLTLSEIQSRLSGADADAVAEIARLPVAVRQAARRERESFWRHPPATPAAAPSVSTPSAATAAVPSATATVQSAGPLATQPSPSSSGFELAPGVTLLLEHPLSPPDLATLRRAAAPLLAALRIPSPNQPD